MKVKKIMIWPSMTINLGNYETAKLSAGVEIELETGDSKEVVKAYTKARKIVDWELKKQLEPFKARIKKRKEVNT